LRILTQKVKLNMNIDAAMIGAIIALVAFVIHLEIRMNRLEMTFVEIVQNLCYEIEREQNENNDSKESK